MVVFMEVRNAATLFAQNDGKGDLAQKKFVDPDLTLWLRDADNLHTDEQEPIVEVTWDERLAQMSRLSTFEQLLA